MSTKYCGVVTDRSLYHGDVLCAKLVNGVPKHQKRRIYSDEVPMAGEETLQKMYNNHFKRLAQHNTRDIT